MKPQKKVVVLGGGIAGLSAAWHLQQKGIPCSVFEKEAEVGGLCRSKRVRDFTFDYSGHLLHFKHRYAFDLIRDLLGENLVKHERSAWIYSSGRYTRYPFQANLYGLPPKINRECLEGFIQARTADYAGECGNFSQWIERTFGEGIARHFMTPYNAKFWTVPPEDLTCEWLDGMIPVPSLNQVLEGSKHESTQRIGYNAYFWYPRNGGIEQVPQALAKRIRNIQTKSPVARIDPYKKEIIVGSGRVIKFDHLISTLPLPEVSRLIDRMPGSERSAFNKLRWNSIFNLNLGIDPRKGDFGQHWVYFSQKEICFFRVGFFHNFSSNLAPEEKKSLYAEIAYSKTKPFTDKQDVVSRIARDLQEVGMFSHGDRICAKNINDIEYGYPIYDRHYHSAMGTITKFLKKSSIVPCGRYGSWRYMSMEDAIMDGKRVAESL